MADNDPVETPEAPEPIEEENETPEGNEPETTETTETTEEQVAETEGDSQQGTSPQEDANAEKSEETAAESPSSIKIDDKDVPVDDLVKAWKARSQVEIESKTAKERVEVADRVLRYISENPKDTFLNIFIGKNGGDKAKAKAEWLKICEDTVVEEFQLSQMPESERKAHEARAEAEEYKRQVEEYKRREENDRRTIAQADRVKQRTVEIMSALKQSNMPEDPALVEVMADIMKDMEGSAGIKAVDVIPLAKEELARRRSELLKNSSEDEILQLRPDLAEKVIKKNLEKARAAKKSKTPQKGESSSQPTKSNSRQRTITSAEWAEMFG